MSLKSFLKHTLFAVHPLLAFASVAAASDMMALRAKATVSGDAVLLGDLVTGAGDKAGIALFKAPDFGKIGTIRAESIRKAAEELGLKGVDAKGLQAVIVSREMRQAPAAEVAAAVRATLIRLDASLGEATVVFDGLPPVLAVAPHAALAVEPLAFDMERGAFTVKVALPDATSVTLTGKIHTLVEVPVLRRTISRGDVIGAVDFALEPRPRRSLPVGLLTDTTRLSSLVARRTLKAGDPIREADLTGRDLVERNQKVTVTYDRPGMSLTLSGKALAAGPAGSVVPVQNLASKRTFDAVVTGEGKVSAKLSP